MTILLRDVCQVVNELWPEATAQEWDRVGLTAGSMDSPVSKILLGVDPVHLTVSEAIELGADVLITHHPLLLRGVSTVAENTAKGALIAQLIRGNCALIAAHTNADQPEDGVSDVLAKRLELHGIRPIAPGIDDTVGIGRVGRLISPVSLREFAQTLYQIVPETAAGIRVAGNADSVITTVALCGGAGDSLLEHPLVREADVYVTSDLRHHPASESRELSRVSGGPALVDVSHWAAESVWLKTAQVQLLQALPGVEVHVSNRRTDPWDFALGGDSRLA